MQIAGGDPAMMADAARVNVELGAQIIDINFGCPAKKVCNHAAGSALMRDEPLVRAILARSSPRPACRSRSRCAPVGTASNRNAVAIARIAEDLRASRHSPCTAARARIFSPATPNTKRSQPSSGPSRIPVFVNGDIDCAAKALKALEQTGADGVMIGRAAQGRPWIFREVLRGDCWNDRGAAFARRRSVLSCFRTSRPCTRSMAKHMVSAWRANISDGIAGFIRKSDTCQPELLTTGSAREQLSLAGAFLSGLIGQTARAA